MLDVGDLPPKCCPHVEMLVAEIGPECCPHVESLKPSPSFRAPKRKGLHSEVLVFALSKIRITGNSPCWPDGLATARFDMDDQAPVGLAIQQLWKLKVAKGRLIVDVCVPRRRTSAQRSVFAERTAVT